MGLFSVIRRASRVDGNQAQIVEELRKLGATVAVTSMVGAGFPDLVVGFGGRNFLFEVKDPEKSPSKRGLTADQVEWHLEWRGQVAVIHDLSEALEVMRESKKA